jgi:hypothetical protein
MSNPEPLDESLPPAEIRGGNRPEDYISVLPQTEPLDITEAFDDGWALPDGRTFEPDYDDEPPGGNDPEAQ